MPETTEPKVIQEVIQTVSTALPETEIAGTDLSLRVVSMSSLAFREVRQSNKKLITTGKGPNIDAAAVDMTSNLSHSIDAIRRLITKLQDTVANLTLESQ